jgi:glycosyltransferase involved in cell wall biosynthesis
VKYWLLTTEYPPFFGGGIGTYCAVTARMFAEKGHSVIVFINDAAVSDIQESEKNGIRIIRFNTSRTKSSSFLGHVTNISYEFAHIVKHFIEKEGPPDIIEAQEYMGIAYYLLQYKYLLYDWCRNVPVLITMHSPSSLYMEYNHVPMHRYPHFWICEMEYFCLQAADYIISPSHYMLRELEKRFLLGNPNIAIIPNPFDGKSGNIKVIPTGKEPDEIVFYGKLTVQKGALRLLAYFKQLWDKGFTRPLFLLGGQDIVYHPEGVTMGDFIRKTYKIYIDQGLLKLEDRIKPSEIGARLSRAEVVIVPSDNDNLPYVVFEMMTLGRIVLVSKQGGQSEIVENGVDGFVFDHEKPLTFFNQLETILALDDKQKETISERAIQKVQERYSMTVIYEQKIGLIEKLLQKKNTKPPKFPFIRNRSVTSDQQENGPFVKDLLSIIITFYNSGKYLDEVMHSLSETKYPHREIIIVNDGSTDQLSLEKLAQFKDKPGVIIINKTNKGLADTRNTGAAKASGEFLAFLDADDKVGPSYYSKAINVLKEYQDVHFVGAWTKYFEGSNKVWPAFTPEPPIILCHNMINSAGLVFKTKSFLAAGQNDCAMVFPGFEDYDSIVSLLSHGYCGVVLPELLFSYRVRPDSMTRGISTTKKLLIWQYMNSKHKSFYGNFAADVFNLSNANGPAILLDNPTLDYHLADKLPFGGKFSRMIIAVIKKNRFVKTIAYRIYKMIKK